ncbi:MAG: hypothetical protein GY701_30870, partial [Sulfitobacter sp.]|nr:hypothetical protein [Sulfitobacter sp.]
MSTIDGDATAADDYTAVSTTLNFAAGVTTQEVAVTLNDDSQVELTETFYVRLGAVGDGGTGLVTASAVDGSGTITDTESAEFTVDSQVSAEDAGPQTFTVTLSNPVDVQTQVDVSTIEGSAKAADDYTAFTSTTLTFAAGATTQEVAVTLTNDDQVELTETFYVRLDNVDDGGRAGLVDASAVDGSGTITNDDVAVFTVDSQVSAENAGPQTFTVTLSNPVDVQTSVAVVTADDSATLADNDYGAESDTLVFNAGVTTQTIVVTPTPDSKVEGTETFFVKLNTSSGWVNGRSVTAPGPDGTGTILNDDAAQFAIDSPSANEDDGVLTFTVTLSNPVDVGTSINMTTGDGTATTADNDYGSVDTTIFFPAESTTQTVPVTPTADDKVEATETFTVNLNTVVDGGRTGSITAPGPDGIGTITNDDVAEFSIDSQASNENAGAQTFTVTLSNPVDVATSVDVATADDSATEPNDYTEVPAGTTLTFAAGVTTQTVAVTLVADTIVERTETYFVGLTLDSDGGRPVTASGTAGAGTIINDDRYSASVSDDTENEGDDLTFTITLDQTPLAGDTVTVDYSTSDNTTAGATDYTPASSSVTFNASDTTKTVTITTVEDDVVEYDESFNLNLDSIASTFTDTGSVIGDPVGIGTITNDDNYKVSVADVITDEPDGLGEGTTTPAAFTLTLNQAVLAGQTATVDYATSSIGATEAGHTETPLATANDDYNVITSSVVFNGGDSSTPVIVLVRDEADDDGTEYYYLNISAGSGNIDVTDATGVGTIIDNEFEVIATVAAAPNDTGDICRGAAPCAGPPPGTITEIIERSSDSSAYTVTADAGFCVADIQRTTGGSLASDTGGLVHISGQPYTAVNIQDDPTNIVASFRSEIHFTVAIEPVGAQLHGRWRLKDTSTGYYVLPAGHANIDHILTATTHYPATATAADAWLKGDGTELPLILPCDKAGFDLEFKEVSGWYTPATVNYSIP